MKKGNKSLSDEVVSRRLAIGAAIRAKRNALGKSLQEVSSGIGKSIATVSKIETGLLPVDLDTLWRIAEVLESTPVRLLWEIERAKLESDSIGRKIIPIMDGLLDSLSSHGVNP